MPVLLRVFTRADATATRAVWSGHVAGLFPVHQWLRFRWSAQREKLLRVRIEHRQIAQRLVQREELFVVQVRRRPNIGDLLIGHSLHARIGDNLDPFAAMANVGHVDAGETLRGATCFGCVFGAQVFAQCEYRFGFAFAHHMSASAGVDSVVQLTGIVAEFFEFVTAVAEMFAGFVPTRSVRSLFGGAC